MGVSPIPLSEYIAYIKMFNCPYDKEFFARVIKGIDILFLENQNNGR